MNALTPIFLHLSLYSAGIVLDELVGLLIIQQCSIRQLQPSKQLAQTMYTAALNPIQILNRCH